jgi:hypothetical protein
LAESNIIGNHGGMAAAFPVHKTRILTANKIHLAAFS